ncbi:MAG: beta-propeller fold lactonase family protein [Nitrososphaeraceae archaeon]|nr:beta-propeller fold lactonase family protein [Nitrososphaeraceae archaeon]
MNNLKDKILILGLLTLGISLLTITLQIILDGNASISIGKRFEKNNSFDSIHNILPIAEAINAKEIDGNTNLTQIIPNNNFYGNEYFENGLDSNNNENTLFSLLSNRGQDNLTSQTQPEELSKAKIHNVTIEAKKFPNGQYGYMMLKHIVQDNNSLKDLTSRYSDIPTIPGPTLEIHTGDKLFLTTIDETGRVKTQNITHEQPRTFPYFGDNFRELGLFGAIIVDSDDRILSKVNSTIVPVALKEVEKQYVLFMVGSTFWGQEIDTEHNQKPLWTNPTLGADLDQIVRFHVLGASNQHTFHTHAHEWIDPGTTNLIDTKLISTGEATSFIIQAGDNAGEGQWHYHCHLFAHMEAGMLGSFKVGKVGSNTQSIPGASPLDPGPTKQGNFITYSITDEPGKFFKNVGGEVVKDATESLAVIEKGGTVHFIMDDTNSVHTISSLLWPSDANKISINSHHQQDSTTSGFFNPDYSNPDLQKYLHTTTHPYMPFELQPPQMPFDQVTAYSGGGMIKLEAPGLYIFTCKIHPYMSAAVLVDDPQTKGVLDLGDELELNTGEKIPSSHPLSLALLTSFFITNNPSNWLDYRSANPEWKLSFPHIAVKTDLGEGYLDEQLLNSLGGNTHIPLDQIANPTIPGIGEVWVDTQFEKTASKSKPGTVTKVNTENWQVERKVSLPEINLNNPHNLWSDPSQRILYQTQWFDNRLTAFDRTNGTLLDDVKIGDAPSHVMTNPANGILYVDLSGEQGIAEIKFDTTNNKFNISRIIPTQKSGQNPTHPQGHWITPDGDKMIVPDHFTENITIFDFTQNNRKEQIEFQIDAGIMPTGTGMMPDGKKAYVSNLLSNNINIVDMDLGRLIGTIDLLASGHAMPVQTPVSPNGQYMVTANSLTGTIAITDTDTNQVVKSLPCDPGCHGVSFGAKKNGGYYAYVTSKFSNRLIVVDGDPNNNGDPTDAVIAGTVLLTGRYDSSGVAQFENDDNMTSTKVNLKGMGGQGVYSIPNVYPGWVQTLDSNFTNQLTLEQQYPIKTFNHFNNELISKDAMGFTILRELIDTFL